MTDRPYSMTTYEVWVGTPKDPTFDWRAEGVGLENLVLNVRLAWGLKAMLAAVRAIDGGRVPGRQVDWGAWIAPIKLARLDELLTEFGWPRPDELGRLDPAAAHYLVAVES